MSEWQDISTAPKDGSEIQARIPDHGEDNIIAWERDTIEGECGPTGSWTFTRDQEPPACWTDGWCWSSNEDGEPSVQPTHWKPAPPPSREGLSPQNNPD